MSHGHIHISFLNKIVWQLFNTEILDVLFFKISCKTNVFNPKKGFDRFPKIKILSSAEEKSVGHFTGRVGGRRRSLANRPHEILLIFFLD
jgi:hypothetical protein